MGSVLSIVMDFDWNDIDAINIALDCTTAINVHQIRRHRLPRLYASGVYYASEVCLAKHIRETCERFLTARKLLAEGKGDCDDLAPYLAAERRVYDGDTTARAYAQRSPAGYHCLVRSAGKIEDPSRVLGMKVT